MAKRFIGIDLEGIDVRVAVLTAGAGKIDVVLDKREYDSPAEAAAAIIDMVGGKLTLGDRLATALPCRVGLFRRIRFPFREKNKIEAQDIESLSGFINNDSSMKGMFVTKSSYRKRTFFRIWQTVRFVI
mgnify:CR=1 FL=1